LLWVDDAFYSRINDAKVAWIESTVGTSCLETSHQADLFYKRCFAIPYVNDLPGEGLEPKLATAIVSTIFG
jgi:hypothetical protein